MKTFRILFVIAGIALSTLYAGAQTDEDAATNCFSIVAGKNATTDGSVLFGHNEDDGDGNLVSVNIGNGIWAELPGNTVADCYMNRNGVCIASDGCQSKEDRDDFSEGGIVYELRSRVWQEAVSAKDAVRIIGREVEKYGYRASGRTYIVADANEGWLVCVVKGRHWVAQRVPDDMVASVPNYYSISKVDLSDKENFAGSPDLIEYAVERGWYNPETDGEFSFRKAYAKPSTLTSDHNTPRHKLVMEALGTKYDQDNVPFAIKADRKVDVRLMRELLGKHREAREDGSHPSGVCAFDTNISTIFQLRSFLPKEVGCVMWICPGKVCAEVHVPWYLGMTQAPKGFYRFDTVEEAMEKHFPDGKNVIDGKSLRERYPDCTYWRYVDRWDALLKDYSNLIVKRSRKVSALQEEIFAGQLSFESQLLHTDAGRASNMMNKYTAKLVGKSLK